MGKYDVAHISPFICILDGGANIDAAGLIINLHRK